MKIIQFIGSYEKTDFVLYVCKLIEAGNKRVLLIDATADQDYQYSFPRIDDDLNVHEHDGIDIAGGFGSLSEIKLHFQEQGEEFTYDYVVVDSSDSSHISAWESERFILFNTMESIYNARNAQLLDSLFASLPNEELTPVIKVFFGVVCSVNEAYIDNLYEKYPIRWVEPTHYLIPDERDYAVKIDNQHQSVIQLKGLTKTYRTALNGVAGHILDLPGKEMNKLWKKARRRHKHGTNRILG